MLHWATGSSGAVGVIGANGEPVATSARPSVQSARSAGRRLGATVGFDSGKMIGRSALARPSARTISSVNAPAAVDRPISAVGADAVHHSASDAARPSASRHPVGGLGEAALGRAEVRPGRR